MILRQLSELPPPIQSMESTPGNVQPGNSMNYRLFGSLPGVGKLIDHHS